MSEQSSSDGGDAFELDYTPSMRVVIPAPPVVSAAADWPRSIVDASKGEIPSLPKHDIQSSLVDVSNGEGASVPKDDISSKEAVVFTASSAPDCSVGSPMQPPDSPEKDDSAPESQSPLR